MLLHHYFENFSTQSEKYYFHMEGSMAGGFEPMQGEIEMNIKMNIPGRGIPSKPDRGPDGEQSGSRQWDQIGQGMGPDEGQVGDQMGTEEGGSVRQDWGPGGGTRWGQSNWLDGARG